MDRKYAQIIYITKCRLTKIKILKDEIESECSSSMCCICKKSNLLNFFKNKPLCIFSSLRENQTTFKTCTFRQTEENLLEIKRLKTKSTLTGREKNEREKRVRAASMRERERVKFDQHSTMRFEKKDVETQMCDFYKCNTIL